MKKIFCELCDGTEFSKEDGMFRCLSCGTKYTPDEAKSMMREVEGEAPIASAPAAPAAPVVDGDKTKKQIDNLLILAQDAVEHDNEKAAEEYCNQIIALDASCYKAWFIKGKACGWQVHLPAFVFRKQPVHL